MSRKVATAPSGTMLAGVAARLAVADVADVLAEGAVGLRRHPVGAAEKIEVVDIGRAEIDLERLEHAVGGHAEHLGAHAVDIGVDLGRARVEEREDAGEAGRLVGRADHLLRRRFERRQVRGRPCPAPSS